MSMQKKSTSKSGFFNPRFITAFTLCTAGALLAVFSVASTPTTSTITVPSFVGQTVTVTWTGTIPPLVNGASDCTNFADTAVVDQHMPNIIVPAGVYNSVNAKFTFNISWDGAAGNDEVLTVLKPNGAALGSSDGGNPTETVTGNNLPEGTYKVIACGFISGPAGQPYTGKLTIDTSSSSGPPPPPPTPTPAPAAPDVPRYYNYVAPPAVGENAGEPSIGYNKTTHKAMYISGLDTFRVTFPATGACEALWEDVSYVLTNTKSLDPILFTDQLTNRTFVSQLNSEVPPASPVLIGLNSLMAYTDDDGANWTPAQINPPDGSYDHQSVGAGPYPTSLPLGNPVNKGSAVYYCSQAGVTAFCSRSDDGGLNFGRSTAIYTSVTDACGGIHGHVKVAPDGTVYVPNRGCGGVQALTVSDNAGTTWTVRKVQAAGGFTAGAPPGILDPSVGIASDGTLYFGYTNTDGHAHAAVSHDKGVTWVNDRDLGSSQNLGNTVFMEAVAGDPLRAAIGFLGTTQIGDHQAADFNGNWYLYIAHTYDGGLTWTTVNATPNDPVQRSACIWNQGGSNQCRNLLDFNEITADEKGRILYSYADGCVGDCVAGGPNSYSSKATIAHQSGGKGILQAFDPVEPIVPQSACLSGHRDDLASYLSWVAPDNGGSDITIYKIFRGTTAGNAVQIGQQVGNKTTFNDRSGDPAVTYVYKIVAVNAVGSGTDSNIVTLSVGPRIQNNGACSIPGVQILTDPTGDETDNVSQHDITSISVAEPLSDATTGAADKLYFTIKVADLAAPITPGWRWSIRFNVSGFPPPSHPIIGPQEDWHVSMVTSDGAAPAFTYGTTGVFQGAARLFVTLGNLDAASNVRPDGTITLVLPKSVFAGIQPGAAITVNLGSVRATAPSAVPGTGGTNETIPDTTGGTSYVLRPANLCLPNAAPLASLAANINEGSKPLSVNFDASASSDSDAIDQIATYTFNFGEGGDDVVQSTPTISHTFTNSGLYDVKLVVTDSRGKVSSNTAHQLIQVSLPLTNIASRKIHGGAGTFDINLPTSGAAGIECRSGGATNDYTIVYTFGTDLSAVDTATVTGAGTVAARSIGPNPNQYTVNLTGVTNAQHLILTLDGVHDTAGAIFNNIAARMDVLVGDTTADGFGNSGDIAQTKSQSGQTVTASNFREDVTVDGNLNSGDIGLVKSKSGTALP